MAYLIGEIQTWIGLSTDTKPVATTANPIYPGSTFYETNTKAWYVYDGSAWVTEV